MKKIFLNLSIIFSILIISCNQSGFSEKEKEENFSKLNELAYKIDNDFIPIRNEVSKLADFIGYLYENQDKNNCNDKKIYAISKDGVMYKTKDDGKSAVFVSGYTPINEEIMKIVCFTEPLDTFFIRSIKEIPAIVQLYYNDKYAYNRIYPFFDVLTQYEPKMNIPEFNFYYLADSVHNPEKKAVWVNEPYIDPAGRGWMVSAIAPVYYKNEFVGVPGIDVTINNVTDKYFKSDNQDILIIDASGVIVSANEQIINLLNLPPLKNHKYFETIKQDTYKKEDFNLLKNKNKNIRTAFEQIINNNSKFEQIQIDDKNYIIYVSILKELKWYIIKMTE
jgi:hypothetical protein